MIGGFTNRVAWIDLSSGNVEYKGIDETDARKVSGRPRPRREVRLRQRPDVEPFSPDNILCIMNGPLTGTNVNMSGRLAVVTKSPLTGTVADAHMGGWTAKLNWAGFDGLVSRARPTGRSMPASKTALSPLRCLRRRGAGASTKRRRFCERHGGGLRRHGPLARRGENLVRFGLLGQHQRPRGPQQLSWRSRRQQAPQGRHRQGRQDESPRKPGRQGNRQGSGQEGALRSWPKRISPPRKGGLSVTAPTCSANITESIMPLPSRNSQYTAFGKGQRAEMISASTSTTTS